MRLAFNTEGRHATFHGGLYPELLSSRRGPERLEDLAQMDEQKLRKDPLEVLGYENDIQRDLQLVE